MQEGAWRMLEHHLRRCECFAVTLPHQKAGYLLIVELNARYAQSSSTPLVAKAAGAWCDSPRARVLV